MSADQTSATSTSVAASTGYVQCAGCGLDVISSPNAHGQTFCGYCKEYAQANGIDLTEPLSANDESAMWHNVEGDQEPCAAGDCNYYGTLEDDRRADGRKVCEAHIGEASIG